MQYMSTLLVTPYRRPPDLPLSFVSRMLFSRYTKRPGVEHVHVPGGVKPGNYRNISFVLVCCQVYYPARFGSISKAGKVLNTPSIDMYLAQPFVLRDLLYTRGRIIIVKLEHAGVVVYVRRSVYLVMLSDLLLFCDFVFDG